MPTDVLHNIYSFDPTYHDVYKKVVREVNTTFELTAIFNGSLVDILESPSVVCYYTKKDFERYAKFLGILTSRKLTRRRLLTKLVCYYLREREMNELPINSLWALS